MYGTNAATQFKPSNAGTNTITSRFSSNNLGGTTFTPSNTASNFTPSSASSLGNTAPTFTPTVAPTIAPTLAPTFTPSSASSFGNTAPTVAPTFTPSNTGPTFTPTVAPTFAPISSLGNTAPTKTPMYPTNLQPMDIAVMKVPTTNSGVVDFSVTQETARYPSGFPQANMTPVQKVQLEGLTITHPKMNVPHVEPYGNHLGKMEVPDVRVMMDRVDHPKPSIYTGSLSQSTITNAQPVVDEGINWDMVNTKRGGKNSSYNIGELQAYIRGFGGIPSGSKSQLVDILLSYKQ